MRDTNDSWLQSGGQQAWLSLKKNGGRSAKICSPRRSNRGPDWKARKHRHESKDRQRRKPAKKTFFQRKVDLSEVKIVSPA